MITLEKLLIDDKFLEMLKTYHIFQARSGMKENEEYSYINRFKVGETLFFARETCIEMFSTFASGNMFFSSGAFSSLASSLPCGSKVGRYTSIAGGLKPMGFRHPIDAVCMNSAVFNFSRENVASYFNEYERKNGKLNKLKVETPQPQKAPIMIGNDVWIGANVTLSGGIEIGNGAVIASNSIVTKDVAPYSIVAGVPAKKRKYRFSEDIIDALQNLKWWEYELGDLYREQVRFSSPELFISDFEKIKNNLDVLKVKKIYPYLYNKESLNLEKSISISDFHGNYLLFDRATNRVIKTKKIDANLLPIFIKTIENGNSCLYVEGKGVLGINNEGFFEINNNVNYNLFFENNIRFSIRFQGKYLSSMNNSSFMWQPNLKAWENFYYFQ